MYCRWWRSWLEIKLPTQLPGVPTSGMNLGRLSCQFSLMPKGIPWTTWLKAWCHDMNNIMWSPHRFCMLIGIVVASVSPAIFGLAKPCDEAGHVAWHAPLLNGLLLWITCLGLHVGLYVWMGPRGCWSAGSCQRATAHWERCLSNKQQRGRHKAHHKERTGHPLQTSYPRLWGNCWTNSAVNNNILLRPWERHNGHPTPGQRSCLANLRWIENASGLHPRPCWCTAVYQDWHTQKERCWGASVQVYIRELKQATFLTTWTSWSKKAELWLVKNKKFISG